MCARIKKSEVEYRIEAEQDHILVRGNAVASGDDAYDKQVEDKIITQLNRGNIWAWAAVTVVASYRGFEGRAHLGACSYPNEAAFKKSGYYEDMKQEAFDDLMQSLKAASEAYTELTA